MLSVNDDRDLGHIEGNRDDLSKDRLHFPPKFPTANDWTTNKPSLELLPDRGFASWCWRGFSSGRGNRRSLVSLVLVTLASQANGHVSIDPSLLDAQVYQPVDECFVEAGLDLVEDLVGGSFGLWQTRGLFGVVRGKMFVGCQSLTRPSNILGGHVSRVGL